MSWADDLVFIWRVRDFLLGLITWHSAKSFSKLPSKYLHNTGENEKLTTFYIIFPFYLAVKCTKMLLIFQNSHTHTHTTSNKLSPNTTQRWILDNYIISETLTWITHSWNSGIFNSSAAFQVIHGSPPWLLCVRIPGQETRARTPEFTAQALEHLPKAQVLCLQAQFFSIEAFPLFLLFWSVAIQAAFLYSQPEVI